MGITLGFLPFFGPWNGYAYPYYGDPYARDPLLNRLDTLPRADRFPSADTLPPFDGRVAVPGPTGTDSLVVEQVPLLEEGTAPLLRVSWRDMGQRAEEVALFLADTAQTILAVQTLRAPPFTALFEPPPETAFAGMTVVWPSGSKATRLVAIPASSR